MKVKDLNFDLDKVKDKVKARKNTSHLVRHAVTHDDRTKWSKKERKRTKQSFKSGMYEASVLTNVRLTDHQKATLATLISRGGDKTTLVDLTANIDEQNRRNITTALQTMDRLGLVTVNPDKTLAVSDIGMQTMQEENLVDESGMLTPEGQEYQFMYVNGEEGKTQGQIDQETDQLPLDQPSTAPTTSPVPPEKPPVGEAISFLKNIAEQAKIKEDIESLNKQLYTVYKAKGPFSDHTYYGYVKGTPDEEIMRASFLANKGGQEGRGVVQLISANDGDVSNIEFTPVKQVQDEPRALMFRNEYREADPESITGPSHFPANIYKLAKERNPEAFANVKQKRILDKAEAQFPTALSAFSHNMFDDAQIKQLAASQPPGEVMNAMRTMTPRQFVDRYQVRMRSRG